MPKSGRHDPGNLRSCTVRVLANDETQSVGGTGVILAIELCIMAYEIINAGYEFYQGFEDGEHGK